MSHGLRQSVLTLLAVGAEVALYHSYRGHDARFHWFTHFFVAAVVVLLVGAAYARRRGRPLPMPLVWVLGAHLFAMFPDLLFQAGVAHERWMDLFLAHISSHFVPGRNITWFALALGALALYLYVLDRLPAWPAYPLNTVSGGAGADTVPVVALHGLGASARYWERLMGAMGGPSVAVDLLGFGRSPKPGGSPYDVDTHAEAIAPSVAAGSVVVAHSAGAVVALRLAVRHPERVGGLVLLGLPAYPDPATALGRIAELGLLARLTAEDRFAAKVVCELMCALRPLAALGAPAILRGVPARVAIDGALHTWPSYSRTLRRVVVDHRVDKDLAAVACPMRLLSGAQDRVAPPELVASALADTGRSPELLAVIEGEGHHLALTRPELVARAVEALRGIPGARRI